MCLLSFLQNMNDNRHPIRLFSIMFNPYSGPVQVQSDPAVGPGDLVQTATGAMTNLRLGPGVRPESGDPSPVPEVTGGEVRNMIQGWEKQDVKRAGWLVIFQCSSFQLEHVLFFLGGRRPLSLAPFQPPLSPR